MIIDFDTLSNFITQLTFSKEMRMVNKELISLENNELLPINNTALNINIYTQNSKLFGYLKKGNSFPILKSNKNSIRFSLADIKLLSNVPKDIEKKFFTWEQSIFLEINSSKDRVYNQYSIDAPYNIFEGFIEVEYSTVGNARPFVILFEPPYSSETVELHDLIPTGREKQTIRLPINKVLENPKLIFRNWAKEGSFKIYNFKIIGTGQDNGIRFTKKTKHFDSYSKDKSRFVAHAGGEIEGKRYTNSLEALNLNYKKGFRMFELDIVKTSDGKFVAAHDWEYWAKIAGYKGDLPISEKHFLEYPILSKFTPLNMKRINKWFSEHPDAILITDKVNSPDDFSNLFIDKKRLMMELFSIKALKEGLNSGIKSAIPSQNVLFSLSNDKILALKKLGVTDIAISRRIISSHIELLERIKASGINTYVYHVNFDKGKDENYVVNYEMDYIYGIYADDWDFE
jgi:glycerophosphoryl diester phosphodiesterase